MSPTAGNDAWRRALGELLEAPLDDDPVLTLITGSGAPMYPAFQYAAGVPVAGLGEVLRELPQDLVSRWTVAAWLAAPEPELDGATPIQSLREGRAEDVQRLARLWAADLAPT